MTRWLAREKDVDRLEKRIQVLEYQFGSLLRQLGYHRDGNIVKPESCFGLPSDRAALERLDRVETDISRLESDVDTRIEQLDGSIRTLGAMIGSRHRPAPSPKKRKAKK